MKAVIPCRVSSKEQEESGYSLPAQEKFLTSYAENKGFEIGKVFHISESASAKKQREEFHKMMDYVAKNDIKILIIEKADRYTRNLKDSVDLYDWLDADEERQLHSVKDSLILHKNSRSQEKLNWDIRIVFAKNYIDNLSEEVKKGQKEKLAQGSLPTKPPPGYRTVGEKGRKIHIVDENKKHFAIKMFEYFDSGNYSLKSLTEKLYEEGLRNDNGNKIVKSRIHQLLTNPFYIKQNRWNNVNHPANHETFIDDGLFNRVGQRLKSRSTPKRSKHYHLFAGLLRCKGCGGVITWEPHKGTNYGHCNHYKECPKVDWAREPDIENQVSDGLKGLEVRNERLQDWIRKALKEKHKDEISYHSTSVAEFNKQHDLLKARLDRLYDDKLDGKISEDDYERRFKRYSDELLAIDDRIKKQSQSSLQYFELSLSFYELSQKASTIYERATVDDKRKLISLVFDTLHLREGTNLEYAYTKPFQILSDAVKVTNSSKQEKIMEKRSDTFEPSEKTVISTKTPTFYSERPIMLPREDSNLEP